jgi:hypothetical protein
MECLFSLENNPDIELFPVRLYFSQILLTYGMTVLWYVVCEEWWLILDAFKTEVMVSCGYSLSIRSYLMFLISLSEFFWSWHMTFSQLIKLWKCGWWALNVDSDLCESDYGTLSAQFGTPLHDQDVQEWRSIIIFYFHCELDGRLKAVEVL